MTKQALQKQTTEGIMKLSYDQLQIVARVINNLGNEDHDYVADAIYSGEGPFRKKSKQEILSDLAQSRKDYEEGRYKDFDVAMAELGKKHGFI